MHLHGVLHRLLTPALDIHEVADETPGAMFLSISIDTNKEVAARYGLTSIPATMILFFSLFCPFIWRLKDVEAGADFKI